MTYRVIVRPAAEQDLTDAVDWYEQQRSGLGLEFQGSLDLLFARLAGSPLIYPTVYRGVHRAVLRRFPYVVYFSVRSETVSVLACLHTSRSPRAHRARTR